MFTAARTAPDLFLFTNNILILRAFVFRTKLSFSVDFHNQISAMGDAPSGVSEPEFTQSNDLLNDPKHVVWKDFDIAVTEFCYSQSLQVFESDTLISTLVGEGENETDAIFLAIT